MPRPPRRRRPPPGPALDPRPSPSSHNPGADAAARTGCSEALAQGRCPVCQMPMTPRIGPRGPYFHCQCPARN